MKNKKGQLLYGPWVYVASDGNYGSGKDLLIVPPEMFTEGEWEDIGAMGDYDRWVTVYDRLVKP